MKQYKLVMFDMDGTLLNGRSIVVVAEKLGLIEQLYQELKVDKEPYKISIEIAKLLRGVDSREILEIVREMGKYILTM